MNNIQIVGTSFRVILIGTSIFKDTCEQLSNPASYNRNHVYAGQEPYIYRIRNEYHIIENKFNAFNLFINLYFRYPFAIDERYHYA